MKIVITGAAGYIGSRLSVLLDSWGFNVVGFDNFKYNQGSMVYPALKDIEFYKTDVTEWSPNLIQHITEADVLIPLAAIVGAPACAKDLEGSNAVNYDWFRNLFTLDISSLRIIYPNTSSGYGDAGSVPCIETTPTKPLSEYGIQKQNTEDLLMERHRHNTCLLYTSTVFGWSWRPRLDLLVNNLTYIAAKEKHLSIFGADSRRNYIHVADVCHAIAGAVCNFNNMQGEIYNLGNKDLSCPKSELIKIICDITKATTSVDETREDPDKRNFILDSSKLENTGWSCKYNLESGIRELLRYYEFLQSIDLAENNYCRIRNY